ncbi:MAG: hypothetical protein AB1489_38245 [Acidobacteriota bacterium]
MPRKSFKFDRTLNASDPGVATVFDDLIKPAMKQLPEKKENNINVINHLSDVVSSVEANASSSVLSDVNRSAISDAISNISSDVIKDVSSDVIANATSESGSRILSETQRGVPTEEVSSQSANTISTSKDSQVVAELTASTDDILSKQEPITDTVDAVVQQYPQKIDRISKKSSKDKSTEADQEQSVRTLARWHTIAEQKIYKIIYNETIPHQRQDWYFVYKDLARKTGYRNKRTIAAAIEGLAEKKSIDIILSRRGDKLGRRYRVYTPTQILARRKENNIEIDEQTKKIMPHE